MSGLERWILGGEYAKMSKSAACMEWLNEEEDTYSIR